AHAAAAGVAVDGHSRRRDHRAGAAVFGRICASHPVLNGNAKVLSANRHRPQNAVVFEPQRPDSDTPGGLPELTVTVTAIDGSDLPEAAARPRRMRRWLR